MQKDGQGSKGRREAASLMLGFFRQSRILQPMSKRFYVTTAIDYANGAPHLGHAYEKVITDVIARAHRALGENVFYLTGLDEHGQKVQQAALAEAEMAETEGDAAALAPEAKEKDSATTAEGLPEAATKGLA